jgi:uncharacterized membrane protein
MSLTSDGRENWNEMMEFLLGQGLKVDRETVAMLEATVLRSQAELYRGLLEIVERRIEMVERGGRVSSTRKITVE